MYAAAGGASLASRQARQKQRQNKQKQLKMNKASAELAARPQQTKHYQNYTDPSVPRLSRVERGTLRPPPAHERRHSASQCHLKEPSRRMRESPSISIPVQRNRLPQVLLPEGGGGLERRCSFVRQVEEMEREGAVEREELGRDFEIVDDLRREEFGSLEYPFSECSQGRAAWQERERGRRCSLSEEARQHRQKQTEAHHRWMKRNRIHDASYGGGSDDDDFFSVYHQSAAANALLYVGLGTTAIGSIIFFVGTGEKGFKTLELRLIGPTLIACGLLCCLVRVLLCAVPSACLRRRHRTRLKGRECPHSSAGYPLQPKYRRHRQRDLDFVDQTTLLAKSEKKVSIVPPNHSLPSTSTSEFKEPPQLQLPTEMSIPEIQLPSGCGEDGRRMSRDDSIFELQTLDLGYDAQSVSSDGSDGVTVVDVESKLTKPRQPLNARSDDVETCLSVVVERNDASGNKVGESNSGAHAHSGIVLSPSQLGQ